MAAQLAIIVIFSSFHFKLFGNHPFFSFVFGMKERKKMMMDRMSDQHASISRVETILTPCLLPQNREYSLLQKNGPTLASFCLFFPFKQKFYRKNCSHQQDSNLYRREHADHLTTTTAWEYVLFTHGKLSCDTTAQKEPYWEEMFLKKS